MMKTNLLYSMMAACGLLLLCSGCLEPTKDNWVDPDPGKKIKLDNAPPAQKGTDAVTEAEFQELVPQQPVTDAGPVSLSGDEELTTEEIKEKDYPKGPQTEKIIFN